MAGWLVFKIAFIIIIIIIINIFNVV